MLRFLIRRLVLIVPTFIGISIVAFAFIRVLPGDPVQAVSGVHSIAPERYQALIQKAATISDQAERAKLYEQAQVIFKKDAPWATIAHSIVTIALAKKVTGYVVDPFGLHHFEAVDVAE